MFSKTTFIFLLSFAIVSCQKQDTDLLQEAQSCLNNSPASEARNCVEKISSLNSTSAYKLKCAAIYIYEGYGSASTLLNGLNELNNPTNTSGCSGNCSSTLIVMNNFNFSRGDNSLAENRSQNLATADETIQVCGATESKAYIQISSLFKMGTLAKMQAYSILPQGQNPTLSELETAVQNLPPEQIGELASTTYNTSCLNNSNTSDASKKYCDQLAAAIGQNSDYTAIGNCLLSKINDENATCP